MHISQKCMRIWHFSEVQIFCHILYISQKYTHIWHFLKIQIFCHILYISQKYAHIWHFLWIQIFCDILCISPDTLFSAFILTWTQIPLLLVSLILESLYLFSSAQNWRDNISSLLRISHRPRYIPVDNETFIKRGSASALLIT